MLRARRGMTRRVLALAAAVSERHLANLETGQGNASVLLLRQLAQALECGIAELVGEDSAASPEWSRIRQLLQGHDEAALGARAPGAGRGARRQRTRSAAAPAHRADRIARRRQVDARAGCSRTTSPSRSSS